jgi:hypothetical protein
MQNQMEKYQAQIETLSEKELEKMARRLNSEELNAFIGALEMHNMRLHSDLIRARDHVKKARANKDLLLGKAWCLVPDECRELLEQCFRNIGTM